MSNRYGPYGVPNIVLRASHIETQDPQLPSKVIFIPLWYTFHPLRASKTCPNYAHIKRQSHDFELAMLALIPGL